jgi:hypothetical protein
MKFSEMLEKDKRLNERKYNNVLLSSKKYDDFIVKTLKIIDGKYSKCKIIYGVYENKPLQVVNDGFFKIVGGNILIDSSDKRCEVDLKKGKSFKLVMDNKEHEIVMESDIGTINILFI